MQLDFFWLLFCLVFKNHSLHLSKAKLTCPKKKACCAVGFSTIHAWLSLNVDIKLTVDIYILTTSIKHFYFRKQKEGVTVN